MSTKRKKYETLKAQLDQDRQSFISHWRDLGDYILPRAPRFFASDTNKGDKKHGSIINSTATLAARTLSSGMMSGVTSPARPWFKLGVADPKLMEVEAVKVWLDDTTKRMQEVMIKSNLYNTLPKVYSDLGVFGTSVLVPEEDFESVVRYSHFEIGSYYLANDSKMRARVFFREFRLTVRQIVEKFAQIDYQSNKYDFSNISTHVKDLWDKGQTEEWIDVCHVIMPNDQYRVDSKLSKYKRFKSVYYERGTDTISPNEDRLLSERGFDEFRPLGARWDKSSEDVYGTNCPGMQCLGDIKALQIYEKRKAQAVEKSINPPMMGPSSLRNTRASILPGDITYIDNPSNMQGFVPVHQVTIGTGDIREDIREHEIRIKRTFYEDLFLMLASSDRRQITATEIEERHEEKLLALGPVLEQINQDLLDPLIDITFNIMNKQGLIAPAPQELQGIELKVEYISIMAQAQKLVGISGIERFLGFASQVVAANPESLVKLDTDEILDKYGEMVSIPPGIIRDDETVKNIRAQQAQAQQAQQAVELAQQGSQAAKNLSDAKLDDNNVLNEILGQG